MTWKTCLFWCGMTFILTSLAWMLQFKMQNLTICVDSIFW